MVVKEVKRGGLNGAGYELIERERVEDKGWVDQMEGLCASEKGKWVIWKSKGFCEDIQQAWGVGEDRTYKEKQGYGFQ